MVLEERLGSGRGTRGRAGYLGKGEKNESSEGAARVAWPRMVAVRLRSGSW